MTNKATLHYSMDFEVDLDKLSDKDIMSFIKESKTKNKLDILIKNYEAGTFNLLLRPENVDFITLDIDKNIKLELEYEKIEKILKEESIYNNNNDVYLQYIDIGITYSTNSSNAIFEYSISYINNKFEEMYCTDLFNPNNIFDTDNIDTIIKENQNKQSNYIVLEKGHLYNEMINNDKENKFWNLLSKYGIILNINNAIIDNKMTQYIHIERAKY